MVRTSKDPSSMDAGALDDLNLDDMFAEDGDIFDDFDIPLEGMGDIITTSSSTKKDTRRAGPRTHRPPLFDDAGNDDDEAEDAALRRRKTKRKSKTPVAFGDEDDDYLDDTQPKKKAKKSKGAAAPVTTKKSNKAVGSTKKALIPPPTDLRASSSVAAAGRFGKRVAGSATKITKRKSSAPDEVPQAPAPPGFIPKQESTYGGLAPGKTHFYPFIESVPPEPNLKSRKQYPQIDKFFAAFTGYMSLGGAGNEGGGPNMPTATAAADLSMESPIMQLLIESFEGVSDRDKAAFGDLKKQAMLACLPQVRHVIQSTDPVKLLPDLYSMCGLLTRQYNFVDTCLSNMEMWCKDEFSASDFCQAFSLPEPFQPEKVGTIIASSNRKWKKQIINVKIAFVGNKDIKGGMILQARMPLALVTTGEKKKADGTSTKKAKAKEKTNSTATIVKKSLTSVSYKAATPRTYFDVAPAERRQRILERVAQLALGLETQLNYRRAKGPSLPTPGLTDNKKAPTLSASYIPPEDPPLHTARMWEWLESAGFFQAALASESQSLKEARLGLQAPELNTRGMLFPTPVRIQGRKETVDDQNLQISSHGLFDRLQSLLVVEDVENTGNKDHRARVDESDDESETDDEESLGFLDQSDEEDHVTNSQSRMDLSDFSLEERTFLHLCSIGLIKKPLFPMVELILDDKDDEIEDDLVNVVGEMSAELNILTARNNARIKDLEIVMDPMNLAYRKQAEEEQASLISRCQSLLKRSKEKTKKSNKQKSAVSGSKDDLDLPW